MAAEVDQHIVKLLRQDRSGDVDRVAQLEAQLGRVNALRTGDESVKRRLQWLRDTLTLEMRAVSMCSWLLDGEDA